MAIEEESRQEIYYIPQNFDDAGGVFGGRFTQRNGIEMAVVGVPILWVNFQFVFPNASLKTALITLILTAVPPIVLCATGIGGESISQIAIAFFRYLKNRRYLSFIYFHTGSRKGEGFIPKVATPKLRTNAVDEAPDRSREHTQEKKKQKAPSTHMELMNSALKERLLQKLELGDDEEMDL